MHFLQIPPPEKMLTSIHIPGIESINFHPIKAYTTDSNEQHPNFNAAEAPVFMQVDHIHTNFVYVSVFNILLE